MLNQKQIKRLPKAPGVYLFKDPKLRVIYVGKALNIRTRVKSRFRGGSKITDFKTPSMLSEIKTVDYIEVVSEMEALLLEANLIKQYLPKYNSRLKDDKSYLYIKITTGDPFPKVLTARREKLPNAKYFGPFPSAKTVRNTLKALRRIFPYCNCDFKSCQRKKSCIYTEIGLDAGPCLGLISQKDYREIIGHLVLLLNGKKEKVLREIENEMHQAAKNEEFEKAEALKKQILGIEYLSRPFISPQVYLEDPEFLAKKRQAGLLELKEVLGLSKIPTRIECYDISNIQGKEATGSMVVFQNGDSDKSQYRHFKVRPPAGGEEKPNDVAMMKEVIRRRLGHLEWPLAGLIVVDGGKGQVSGAIETLDGIGYKIPLIGLAKRLEEIVIPKESGFEILRLRKDSAALHILEAIRDEAHRFAINYHRKLRIKGFRRS